MVIHALADALETVEVSGDSSLVVTGITCDSRRVRAGFLYAAVPGLKLDGRDYIPDALARGATTILTHDASISAGAGTSVLCVPDVRVALALLASTFYGCPSEQLDVVGITGTNGKTTTSYLIRAILKDHDRSPGVIGTIAYEVGDRVIPATRTTPAAPELQSLLAQMVKVGCKSAVLEVSSHALVQSRVHGVDFGVCVLTNVSPEHLDYHQTMESYYHAKSRLFDAEECYGSSRLSVINRDDKWGLRLLESGCAQSTLSYGLCDESQVKAVDLEMTISGSRFLVVTPWGQAVVETPLLGRFNVYNLLAAIATGGGLGFSLESVVSSVSNVSAIPGRLERVGLDHHFDVFVDYAHTAEALEQVLITLREVAVGKLIVVFGCGGDRDRSKRPAMGLVAGRLADVSILTADNPRSEDPLEIIAEIQAGFESLADVTVEVDRERAIETAMDLAERGDLVLIAGKGHETSQATANRSVPFDDRVVVRRFL